METAMVTEMKSRIEGDDVLVFEYCGKSIDASNVREFRAAAESAMADRSRIVLDMSGIEFVDSSGLGVLIGCLREASGRKGDFKLCAMSRTVRALFELMRMHNVFNIYESREEAVRAFA
ncbi:MAG: STAS domain-containing protein [Burkholderiales bacterium]